ncbi:MAG TPA: SgcJ/EcaC family oxidoreductase [Dongiaceae bacterium]|jgi:uncharacterized protein (TIGR02246 family)|nr:SgcJ/EcaC family oxidoreductase [Dongiaceae bacterium]
MSPEQIAADFVTRWARAWSDEGPAAATRLYTSDSMLVGGVTAIGRSQIETALTALFNQGWASIDIKVTHARAVNGMVLVASDFTATGSGPNAGKTLAGRSTHALTQIDGAWLSVMHTAA